MKRLKTILLFLLTSLALSSCDFLMPRIGQSDNSSSSSSNSNSSNTDTQDGWYDYDVLRGINCGLPYEFHLHQNYNQDYDYKNGQIIEFKYEFLIDGVLRNEYVFVDTDFYNFSYYSNDFRSVILTPNFQGDVGVTFVINNIDDGSLNNVFGVNVHSSQAQKSGYHVGLHFQKTKYVYDQYENICLDFEAYNIRSQQSRYYTTDIYWGDIASDNYTFLDIKPIMAGQYDARFFLEEDNHELAHIRFAINDNGISNNPYLEPFSSNFGVQGKVGEMVELGFNTNYSTAELLSSADFLFSVDNRVLPVDILDNFARFFLNQEGLVDITIILPDGNQVLFGSINVLAYEPIIETESANNPYYLSHKNSVNEINSDYVYVAFNVESKETQYNIFGKYTVKTLSGNYSCVVYVVGDELVSGTAALFLTDARWLYENGYAVAINTISNYVPDYYCGTIEAPLSPEEAHHQVDIGNPGTLYVKGVVSTVSRSNQYYNIFVYDASFTDSMFFEFYNASISQEYINKYLEGNIDLLIGREVVFTGVGKLYTTTYELNRGCTILSFNNYQSDFEADSFNFSNQKVPSETRQLVFFRKNVVPTCGNYKIVSAQLINTNQAIIEIVDEERIYVTINEAGIFNLNIVFEDGRTIATEITCVGRDSYGTEDFPISVSQARAIIIENGESYTPQELYVIGVITMVKNFTTDRYVTLTIKDLDGDDTIDLYRLNYPTELFAQLSITSANKETLIGKTIVAKGIGHYYKLQTAELTTGCEAITIY